MIGPRDVGHRVVVRRRVGTRDNGRPLLSDLLGDLIAADERVLVVRTRDGQTHAVPVVDVTAAKRVPPRPAAYSEIAELERVAEAAWPAPDRELLGEWVLRAADGWTGRANTALPIGDPGLPLAAAIEAVVDWYSARGLPPAINVPLPLRRDVDRALAELGWTASPPTLVQVGTLAGLLDRAPERPDLPPVRLRSAPSAAFLSVVEARKRGLPAAARHILTAVVRVRFAEVYSAGGSDTDSGDLLAMARGAVVGSWLQLGLIETAERARRTGLARHVQRALASWAVENGADRAFLQVEEANRAALALYEGLGFATHHHYVTWRRLSP